MRLTFLPLGLVALLLLTPALLFAEEPSFTVRIDFHPADAGTKDLAPSLVLPDKPASTPTPEDEDKAGAFYVVVKNAGKSPVDLELAASDWWTCLQFTVTAADGKTYLIQHPPRVAWNWNPLQPWMAKPGEEKTFIINFATGDWAGFPPAGKIPPHSPYKIKATFSYRDWNYKKNETREGTFDSAAVNVQNGR